MAAAVISAAPITLVSKACRQVAASMSASLDNGPTPTQPTLPGGLQAVPLLAVGTVLAAAGLSAAASPPVGAGAFAVSLSVGRLAIQATGRLRAPLPLGRRRDGHGTSALLRRTWLPSATLALCR